MILLKKGNFIDETKLDKKESILFVYMLKQELIRHNCEMLRAKERIYYQFASNDILVETFWKCQNENHKIDCIKIEKCISYLKLKWGLQ